MSENGHPIRLINVFFTRSVVLSVAEHVPVDKADQPMDRTDPITGPVNKIDVVQVEGMPNVYQASMRTLLNQEANPLEPYIVDVECVGIFNVDESLEKDEALRGVTITAHSVLYGAIRESVAWITGRHPFGPLVLGLSVLKPASSKQSL